MDRVPQSEGNGRTRCTSQRNAGSQELCNSCSNLHQPDFGEGVKPGEFGWPSIGVHNSALDGSGGARSKVVQVAKPDPSRAAAVGPFCARSVRLSQIPGDVVTRVSETPRPGRTNDMPESPVHSLTRPLCRPSVLPGHGYSRASNATPCQWKGPSGEMRIRVFTHESIVASYWLSRALLLLPAWWRWLRAAQLPLPAPCEIRILVRSA